MGSIYIAGTPFNVLLSYCVALDSPKAPHYLYVISDFANAKELVTALQQQDCSPFNHVELLPGTFNLSKVSQRALKVAHNARLILKRIQKKEFSRLFVANDRRPEAQAVLHLSKSRNKNIQTICLDDGAINYQSIESKFNNGFIARLCKKLLYGHWWIDTTVMGTTPWIDEIWALSPESLRPELRQKTVCQLPVNTIHRPELKDLAKRTARSLGVDEKELAQVNALLILAHSSVSENFPEYGDIVRAICEEASRNDIRLGVKYHPRESSGDFCDIGQIKGFHLIPNALPLEFLYLLSPNGIHQVIGEYSTALMSARWLLQDASVWSFATLLGNPDDALARTFQTLGVQSINTLDDCKSVFS